jgi:hypothetical protein
MQRQPLASVFCAETTAGQCFTFFEWISLVVKLCWSGDIANNFTDSEMADMHIMFSQADGSTREAHHLYQ